MTLAAIRKSIVGLTAQATLPIVLNARPQKMVRRRPYRSDNGPSTSMLAANAKRYPTKVSCTFAIEVSRAAAIAGIEGTYIVDATIPSDDVIVRISSRTR
jgi:hypothetical protein